MNNSQKKRRVITATIACLAFLHAVDSYAQTTFPLRIRREAIAAVGREGGEVIAEVSLVDRSNGEADLGVPFFPLIDINFPTYADDEVPEDLAAIEITKPGSRKA